MPARHVSFIVTARNEPEDMLVATVRGIRSTSSQVDCEIIVIDDASTAPVPAIDDVTWIRNAGPIGTSRSRRLGAASASGGIFVWMDAHMSFAPDWLERMLEHVDTGAVLCSSFWNYQRSTCHAYGADFQWRDGKDGSGQRYPGFAVKHRTRHPGVELQDVPMIIGGCYMMRRETYDLLGGFSPLSRVGGGSEQDLSARAWIAGIPVRCVSGAQVGHHWRPKFPYPVQFSQLEFNQLASIKTIFESATVEALERFFQPYNLKILQWLSEDGDALIEWRKSIQTSRKIADSGFFTEFVPELLRYTAKPASRPAKQDSTSKAEISFIVVARDESPQVLAETVEGLLSTSRNVSREVIVIDDGSLVPVDLSYPDTRVIRNDLALGVAQSRRLGGELASGTILSWLDAHMHFAPDWLDQMLEHAGSEALLCAAWWDYDLSRPVCWGAEYVWCGERDYHKGRLPGLAFRHLTKAPDQPAVEVPMVIGACYMALRASYDRMGGFSPFFRIWGKSEQDISARAWITGVGVKCVTNARVGHLSRSRFPYPVSWTDIEFNQAITFRTVLEASSLQTVERLLGPFPEEVNTHLAQVNYQEWREHIQSHRRMTDAEFFRRYVPSAPAELWS